MFKQLAVAAIAATAFGGALAADQTVSFNANRAAFASGYTNVLDGGSDVITFDNLASGTYEFKLSLSALFADVKSVSLNGVAGTVMNGSFYSFGYISGTANTPLQLTIVGTALSADAHYSGEMRVTAVPEPETYALMLAGLGAVGFMARRRKIAA